MSGRKGGWRNKQRLVQENPYPIHLEKQGMTWENMVKIAMLYYCIVTQNIRKNPWVHTVINKYFVNVLSFGHTAQTCGILVPRPGIEPASPALEAQSLNHRTAREVLINNCFLMGEKRQSSGQKYSKFCITYVMLRLEGGRTLTPTP